MKIISYDVSCFRPFAIKAILIFGSKTSFSVLIFKNPAEKKTKVKIYPGTILN